MTKTEQIRKTVDAIRAKEMTTPDEVFGAAIDLFAYSTPFGHPFHADSAT